MSLGRSLETLLERLPSVRFVGENSPDEWAWLVRSDSDLRVFYDVAVNMVTGQCSCSCMDFQCRRRSQKPDVFDGCKHVKKVLAEAEKLT